LSPAFQCADWSARSQIPQMKESRFYRISLALPLATPALFASLFLVDSPLPESLQWLVIVITMSGVIGGIPYLALVGILLWWARRKSDNEFRRALLLLPFLMLPVFFVFVIVINLIMWTLDRSPLLRSGLLLDGLALVPIILVFGYCYVLLVFGTAFVLKRLGLLVPRNAI